MSELDKLRISLIKSFYYPSSYDPNPREIIQSIIELTYLEMKYNEMAAFKEIDFFKDKTIKEE